MARGHCSGGRGPAAAGCGAPGTCAAPRGSPRRRLRDHSQRDPRGRRGDAARPRAAPVRRALPRAECDHGRRAHRTPGGARPARRAGAVAAPASMRCRRACGCCKRRTGNPARIRAQVHRPATAEAELQAIAGWCLACVRAQPDARLLVMLPGPAGARERLAALIREALDPGALLDPERRADALAGIEGGRAARAKPRCSRTRCSACACSLARNSSFESVAAWLRAPFWHSPSATQRAALGVLWSEVPGGQPRCARAAGCAAAGAAAPGRRGARPGAATRAGAGRPGGRCGQPAHLGRALRGGPDRPRARPGRAGGQRCPADAAALARAAGGVRGTQCLPAAPARWPGDRAAARVRRQPRFPAGGCGRGGDHLRHARRSRGGVRRDVGGGTVRAGAAAAGAPGSVPAAECAGRSRRPVRQRSRARAPRRRRCWRAGRPAAAQLVLSAPQRVQDLELLPSPLLAGLGAAAAAARASLAAGSPAPAGADRDARRPARGSLGHPRKRSRGQQGGDAAEPVRLSRVRGAAPGKHRPGGRRAGHPGGPARTAAARRPCRSCGSS